MPRCGKAPAGCGERAPLLITPLDTRHRTLGLAAPAAPPPGLDVLLALGWHRGRLRPRMLERPCPCDSAAHEHCLAGLTPQHGRQVAAAAAGLTACSPARAVRAQPPAPHRNRTPFSHAWRTRAPLLESSPLPSAPLTFSALIWPLHRREVDAIPGNSWLTTVSHVWRRRCGLRARDKAVGRWSRCGAADRAAPAHGWRGSRASAPCAPGVRQRLPACHAEARAARRVPACCATPWGTTLTGCASRRTQAARCARARPCSAPFSCSSWAS